MKNKKWFASFLVVVLLISMSSQSLAWWGKDKAKPKKVNPDKRMEVIAEKLELTDKQKETLKAHKLEMREDMVAHRKKMREISDKFKAELEKSKPNRKALHSLIRAMNEERVKMEIKRMDSLLELRSLLTPEQVEKFKEMTEKRKHPGPKGSRRPW